MRRATGQTAVTRVAIFTRKGPLPEIIGMVPSTRKICAFPDTTGTGRPNMPPARVRKPHTLEPSGQAPGGAASDRHAQSCAPSGR